MLDANASDFVSMEAAELVESIRTAEGRTIAAEIMCSAASLIEGVSNGELAASMGADIVVLDGYDCMRPVIIGVPPSLLAVDDPLLSYRRLLGRPLGVNLIAAKPSMSASLGGRLATASSAETVAAQGANIVFLYARPRMGGTPEVQQEAARVLHAKAGKRVMLVGVPSFNQPPPRSSAQLDAYRDQINALMVSGCHGIGLPMPGSKQGWTDAHICALVDAIHVEGGLAWLFLTGSVEGAQSEAMIPLALAAKKSGADAFRLDEAGLGGMPSPENILAFSLALRGRRHTYRRMASSVLR